jgi:hypothetical protein
MSRRSEYPRNAMKVAAWFAGLVTALVCTVVASSCSSAHGTYPSASVRHAVVSRPIPGVRVGLAPTLDGGSAGWCIAETSTYSSRRHSGAICTGARTSTGPIVVESCSENKTPKVLASARVVVLTRGEVAAVTVAGGRPIPTESTSTLPAGLRAAAIELPGYKIVPKSYTVGYPWLPCPRVTPLDANDKPIDKQGRSGNRLAVPLPRRYWRPPGRPPSGVCQLTSTRLPRETVVIEGTVTTRVRPFPELLGQAFVSCTETTYFYQNNHDLPAAVLLDAAHPGAVPPGLLGMKPLAGHPSVFEAPPDMFARRIRGAWLVVEEEDNIGPSVPVELLEHLRATIHL